MSMNKLCYQLHTSLWLLWHFTGICISHTCACIYTSCTWMYTREIIFTKYNHPTIHVGCSLVRKFKGYNKRVNNNHFQWSRALVLIVEKVCNTHLSVLVMMMVFVLLEITQTFHSVAMNHPQTDLFPGWETPLVQLSPFSLSSSPHLVVHS